MLRISENGSSDKHTSLRLEGQVTGQGVIEVQKLCEQRLAAGRQLTLDLADVLFVDRSGVALLRDLMRRQVALVNCSPFLTEQLKEGASGDEYLNYR
jgi:ABC-type transporter Mla MlaB component